jgi:Cu2+-containing amine oxidase
MIDVVLLGPASEESDERGEVLSAVQPAISPEEYCLVESLCQQFPPLLRAMEKRGLDPAWIVADAWCVGHTDSECDPSERICWPSLYYFNKEVDHLPYARPIEGIEMRISLTHKVCCILIRLVSHL